MRDARVRNLSGCNEVEAMVEDLRFSGTTKLLLTEEFVRIALRLGLFVTFEEAQNLALSRASLGNKEGYVDESNMQRSLKVGNHTVKFEDLRARALEIVHPSIREKVLHVIDLLRFYTSQWTAHCSSTHIRSARKSRMEVVFVRHAHSESNHAWDMFNREPFLFDPSLSQKGFIQANCKAAEFMDSPWQPEMVVSSPLRRSLITASIIANHTRGKVLWVAQPLCRERVSGADDIGNLPSTLSAEFPDWNFNLVPSNFWWECPDESKNMSLSAHIAAFQATPWEEKRINLVGLIRQLHDWLWALPATRILVVSHGSYLEKATRVLPFRNCQHKFFRLSAKHPNQFSSVGNV